jgi:hypothetical protein
MRLFLLILSGNDQRPIALAKRLFFTFIADTGQTSWQQKQDMQPR